MDRRALVSGSIASNVALVVTILSGLLLTALVARYLSALQFGVWAILNTVAHYASFAGVGIPAAVTWRVASERGAGRPQASFDALVAGILLLGATGLLAGGVVFGLAGELAAFFRIPAAVAEDFRSAVVALAAAIALGSFANAITSGINGLERLEISAALSVAASLARLAATVALLRSDWGLEGVIWGQVFAHLVTIGGGAAVLFRGRTAVAVSTVAVSSHLQPLASFAASAALLTIASNVTMTSAVVISGRLLPAENVAVVAVVLMLVGYMVAFVVATMRPLEPRFASLSGSNRIAEQSQLLYRSLMLSASLTFAMLVMLVVLGRNFLTLWLGTPFANAAVPLSVAAISFSGVVAQIPVVTLIMARARHRSYGWLVCLEALINVALTIWLCRRYGIMGAILGTVIPFVIIRGLGLVWWGCRLLDLELKPYISALLAPASAAALAIVAAYPFVGVLASSPLLGLSAALPLLALYCVGLVFFLRLIDLWQGSDQLHFALSLLPSPLSQRISMLMSKIG